MHKYGTTDAPPPRPPALFGVMGITQTLAETDFRNSMEASASSCIGYRNNPIYHSKVPEMTRLPVTTDRSYFLGFCVSLPRCCIPNMHSPAGGEESAAFADRDQAYDTGGRLMVRLGRVRFECLEIYDRVSQIATLPTVGHGLSREF